MAGKTACIRVSRLIPDTATCQVWGLSTFMSFHAPSRDIVGGTGFKGQFRSMRNCTEEREVQEVACCCDMAVWAKGLTRYGLYYAGIVDESQLDEVLELHKRDTVSTFGTHSSRRVTKKGATQHKLTTDECPTKPSDDQPESDQTESDHTVTFHQVSRLVTWNLSLS